MAISWQLYLTLFIPSFVSFAGLGIAWGQFTLSAKLSLEAAGA
ncbi:hypothetical protein [Endozoicomonas acroporae]